MKIRYFIFVLLPLIFVGCSNKETVYYESFFEPTTDKEIYVSVDFYAYSKKPLKGYNDFYLMRGIDVILSSYSPKAFSDYPDKIKEDLMNFVKSDRDYRYIYDIELSNIYLDNDLSNIAYHNVISHKNKNLGTTDK